MRLFSKGDKGHMIFYLSLKSYIYAKNFITSSGTIGSSYLLNTTLKFLIFIAMYVISKKLFQYVKV